MSSVDGDHGTGSDGGRNATDDDRSLGQLVAGATTELSALVHDEIALAKAELRQDVKRGVAGGASIGIAGILALASLPLFSFALAYGLQAWTGGHNGEGGWNLGWCFAIVGGVYLLIGGLLALIAKSQLGKIKPPEKSIASAKETAAALQGVKPHPRPVTAETKAVARSSS